jgi:mono/diheme cytochrome c family protein
VLATATATATAALGAGGCGGHDAPRGSRPSPPSPSPALGASVFAQRCTVCHSLNGIGPRRSAGGDLTGYEMSADEVRLLAATMPVRPKLSARELTAVAAYVASVQRRARAG